MCYRDGKIYGCKCKRKIQPSDKVHHNPRINPNTCTKKELRLIQIRQNCPRCRGVEDLEPDVNENGRAIWLRPKNIHKKYSAKIGLAAEPEIPAPPAPGFLKRLFVKAKASSGIATRTVSNAGTRPVSPVRALRSESRHPGRDRDRDGFRKGQVSDPNLTLRHDGRIRERHISPPRIGLEVTGDQLPNQHPNVNLNEPVVEAAEESVQPEEQHVKGENQQAALDPRHQASRRDEASIRATRRSNAAARLTRRSDNASTISGIGTEMLRGAPDFISRR
jgi:hypothetical protein